MSAADDRCMRCGLTREEIAAAYDGYCESDKPSPRGPEHASEHFFPSECKHLPHPCTPSWPRDVHQVKHAGRWYAVTPEFWAGSRSEAKKIVTMTAQEWDDAIDDGSLTLMGDAGDVDDDCSDTPTAGFLTTGARPTDSRHDFVAGFLCHRCDAFFDDKERGTIAAADLARLLLEHGRHGACNVVLSPTREVVLLDVRLVASLANALRAGVQS